MITKSEKFFDASKKITESKTEKESQEESDRSVPIWVKVLKERFNLIKQIINRNKSLGTTINYKRYTLNDADDLVNKIAKKKKNIGKSKAINIYNNLVKGRANLTIKIHSDQTKNVRNIKLFGRNF